MAFVSLHNHTHFSILNSLSSPKDLFDRAKELNHQAIGITDYGNLAASWDCLKLSKETGVKLVIGEELFFTDDVKKPKQDNKLRYIVLLAKNAQGYKNLLILNKIGYENGHLAGKRVLPTIDWSMLEKYHTGLICLTGCGNGIIGQLINKKLFDEAEKSLRHLKEIFGDDLGAEIQTNNSHQNAAFVLETYNQIFTNSQVIKLAQKLNVKIIPTNNSHYTKPENAKTADLLTAIGTMQPVYSNARVRFAGKDLCLKSEEEVKKFFARNYGEEFANQICDNTIDFANRCEDPKWIDPTLSIEGKVKKELPVFPVEDEPDYKVFKIWLLAHKELTRGLDVDQAYLRFKCEESFKTMVPKGKEKEYRARLEEELDTLYYCGVSSYMLITADFLNWARSQNIPVGTGRGSASGSLVSYLLKIHIVDPIKYKLVFARFHNKLRTAFSDIDSDVSKEHRQDVLQYLIKKYGQDRFAQITNYIYITPKVYARDLCRSLELGGSREKAIELGDAIADVIPKIIDGKEVRSFKDAIEKSAIFNEYASKYKEIKDYADICGKPRALGIHASGVVITNRPVYEVTPIRIDKDKLVSIQYEKDKSEETGLVKIDILGLETLDIIEATNKLIEKSGKEIPKVDYEAYDKKTYDLISSGKTLCTFQFGTSGGTIALCKKVMPKSIDDLSVITTLARPAAKNFREDYVKCKEGKQKVKLLHPSLGNALNDTYGFPLYDESLLILARDVANWDLAEADKLRKLTKLKGKDPAKAEKWRLDFIDGAVKNKIPRDTAIQIWNDIVLPFGNYAFCRAHATAYSLISYHTAYLKAHYPLEFLLSNLQFELRSGKPIEETNVNAIKNEIQQLGIKILPPDINKSNYHYEVSENCLITGLSGIKNCGEPAIQDILTKRPFKDFNDFMVKSDSKAMRANAIQSLAAVGAFDSFGISRKLIFLYCSDYRKKLQVWLKKHDPTKEEFVFNWPVEKEFAPQEIFALEKEFLGETFVSKKYGFNIFKKQFQTVKEIKNMCNKETVPNFAGEIKHLFEFTIKKQGSKLLGKKMIKLTLEDVNNDVIDATMFPDALDELKRTKKQLEIGSAISIGGTVNEYDDNLGIIINNVYQIETAPKKPKDLKSKKINLKIDKKSTKTTETSGTLDIGIKEQDIVDDLTMEGFLDVEENDF